MRFYETMFILKPTLTQEEIDAKIEFFKNIILSNGATIEGVINMAMRNLAYEIKKHKRGYYFVIYFKAPPTLIAELERNYRINEDILRFIVINYETKREQKTWQTLVDRANGKIVANDSKAEKLKKKETSSEIENEKSDGADTQHIDKQNDDETKADKGVESDV